MSEFDDDKKMNPDEEQNTEPAAPETPGAETGADETAATAANSTETGVPGEEPVSPKEPEGGQPDDGGGADEANTTYHFSYRNAGAQNSQNSQDSQNNQSSQGSYGYGGQQNNAGSYSYSGQGNNAGGSYNYSQNNAGQGAYGYYSANNGNGNNGNNNGNGGASNGAAPDGSQGKQDKPAKQKKAKKGSKTSTTVKVIAIILAACIVIAGIAIGVSLGSTGSSGDSSEDEEYTDQIETKDQEAVATKDDDGDYTVAGVAAKCMDSCVGISTYAEVSSYYNYFFNYGSDSETQEQLYSEGSGVLMLESGGKTYVMTCAHVISEGSRCVVTLNDGTECDATIVGYDSQTDIGVLAINETGLSIAEFANSDSCVVGEEVVAIGCPGGVDFMNSVTHGCISALDRPISSSIGYNYECIQTDAAINPGNSGGALFNMQGQVVGINSARIASTDYENIGFAVPSNTAVNTANSLINVGYVTGRAKIGITYTNIENYSNSDSILSALESQGYKDANGAMVINEVTSDSDLANKDVRQFDIIIAVDGKTLTDTDIMTSALAEKSPGDTITLTIARVENNSIDIFDIDCKLIESTE